MKTTLRIALLALATMMFAAGAFAAADKVTVGTVTATGSNVDVPLYINDLSGTPLGMDQAAGSKIQSYSIKVTYAPTTAIQSITVARAGITAGLTPTAEFTPSTSNSISIIDTFSESTNPIPFTLNAAAPGNQVAVLHVTLSSSATPGTSIALTLDMTVTQLSNQGGTVKEDSTSSTLIGVNGAINVPSLVLSLSPATLSVPAKTTGTLTVSINSPQSSPTNVTLTSSAPTVALVPSVVAIPAGALSTTANVTAQSTGTATITGALSTGATATANVIVTAALPCTAPSAPAITAPATASSASSYSVSWQSVAGATDYAIDESTDAAFTSPVTQTTSSTSASFSHSVTSATTWYYRVRAHTRAGSCDVTSTNSNVASVVVNPAAIPALPIRVIPVVGSVPGNFGSYFRTSVQLFNPQPISISGKIIFHTQGATGASSDPSLAYVIAPGKTLSYADLLPAIGVAQGLGTADVVADLGSSFPSTLVRVFNDGGTNGTTGLTEDALKTSTALQAGDKSVLLGPADAKKLRLNIGVRTLENGAAVNFVIRDADGNVVKTVAKAWDPTFFQQVSAGQLLDYTFAGGESVAIEVTAGSAFIYGSTTDNTSQDPSVQFANRIE